MGIQALWGLATVAKLLGGKAARTLKPSHMEDFVQFVQLDENLFILKKNWIGTRNAEER